MEGYREVEGKSESGDEGQGGGEVEGLQQANCDYEGILVRVLRQEGYNMLLVLMTEITQIHSETSQRHTIETKEFMQILTGLAKLVHKLTLQVDSCNSTLGLRPPVDSPVPLPPATEQATPLSPSAAQWTPRGMARKHSPLGEVRGSRRCDPRALL